MRFLLRLLLNGIAIVVAAWFVPGVRLEGLASALMADPSVFGAELVSGRVAIRTADYEAFTRALPRVARDSRVSLFEVTPTDESLESVFSYLVRR